MSQTYFHYNEMICACVKVEDCQQAEHWLQQMIVKPNVHSFSTVVVAFAKSMNTARAVYWLGATAGTGMCCDVMTCGMVLDACIKADDLLHAKQVFLLMRDSGLQPNIRSYKFLVQAHAKVAD